MIVRLSDGHFISTAHMKVAPPEDNSFGEIPTGNPPLRNPMEMDWSGWSAKLTGECQGRMNDYNWHINGKDMTLWCCSYAYDLSRERSTSHGAFYKAIATALCELNGDDPSGLEVGGNWDWPETLSAYNELVAEWGYNNRLVNVIPAHRFIELLVAGRFSERSAAEYCGQLLIAIGLEPGKNPLEKGREVFKTTEALAKMLKVLASQKLLSKSQQEQQYTQTRWNQRTKNTSTIF